MLFKINGLHDYRYSITKPYNETRISVRVSLDLPHEMSTTYKTLIDKHKTRLRSTSNSASIGQVIKNHESALRRFLQSVEKSESSPVGPELAHDFENCLRQHIANSQLSQRAQSDRRSLLNAWKLTYAQLGENPINAKSSRERRVGQDSPEKQNPFEVALKVGLKNANLTPKAAARRAGVSPSALGRWTRGALPNTRSVSTLKKVEQALGMKPNSLTTALAEATSTSSAAVLDESRVHRGQRSQSPYRLKAEQMSEALFQEWQDYFEYKTVTKPIGLKRGNRGQWSLVDPKDSSSTQNRVNCRNGKICASAQKTWELFASFFGYLLLPKSVGGYGLPDGYPISLAWLAVPEAIDAFLEFYTVRSNGLKHGGQQMFCASVATMLLTKTGYLLQQPDFADRLPVAVLKGRPWQQLCEQTYDLALAWTAESNNKSRNPVDALTYFLSQDYPLDPIFHIMEKLRGEAESAPAGSLTEAVARRNELLLGLLVSNPLRAKNISTMTYKPNNTGELYKDGNGAWRIRILGTKFKNRRRVGAQKYDVPVAKWLNPLLNDYVKDFRPRLLVGKVESDFLFLSSTGSGKLNKLGACVFDIVMTYLPESGGISAHAFRHLVATDWLTRFPNDFVTVAEILNDTIGVVIKAYAHLKKETSFNRYEEHVASMMTR
ncbi:MAG: helix-turn-helix domain-containing protein [Rhodoferax sp.]|nr:helix-turn-helix domain-containing protein [Rhodoferax sp.]